LRNASRIVDPASIRWIGFSHFESDECESMYEWLVAVMKKVLGKDK
jgi:flavorubredoxin